MELTIFEGLRCSFSSWRTNSELWAWDQQQRQRQKQQQQQQQIGTLEGAQGVDLPPKIVSKKEAMSTFVGTTQASSASAGEIAAPARKGSVTATHAESNGVSNGSQVLADGYPADLEIPIRYIKGMEYDMAEARRRWIATLEVRMLGVSVKVPNGRKNAATSA